MAIAMTFLAHEDGAIIVAHAGKIVKYIAVGDVIIIHVAVGSVRFVLSNARKDVIHVDAVVVGAIVTLMKKIGDRGRMRQFRVGECTTDAPPRRRRGWRCQ